MMALITKFPSLYNTDPMSRLQFVSPLATLQPSPRSQKAPIAVSADNNVYVVWFTDNNGKSFGEIIKLSDK
jgi:hypothetical protein